MKGAVLVSVLSVIVTVQSLTDDQKQKIIAAHTECSASTGVDPGLVEKARKGDFVDDAKLKEYFFCLSKKLGFQNEAGDPQVDTLKAKIGEELKDNAVAEKIVAMCAIKKESPQQTAFDSVKCYYENTPTHISIAA